ncbi:MAG: peptidase M14 [Flavobacterium sp.]|nr:peptidase M14 [Flavobacterium sp.]
MDYLQLANQFSEKSLYGRYITLEKIEPLLLKRHNNKGVKIIGESVLQKPVYGVEIGNGSTRILLWSQMHGNESTTTKALFDLFNYLDNATELQINLLNYFTFYFIPMLNPDGAELYTRENANKIDLNRDAQDLSQPESVILRNCYESFKPNYCYNLHDQRTIFGVGNTNKPATISFLSPSFDEERSFNEVRSKAVKLIVAIDKVLQKYIPNQVGRFDDSFNLNCIGDAFQNLGTPTLLFEAGHFQNDYNRDETRKYVFIALLSSFVALYENVVVYKENDDYMNIPQNNTDFFDFVFKNVKFNYDNSEIITNFAAQYKEELINNNIFFNAFVVKIDNLDNKFGHFELDANGKSYTDGNQNFPQINQKADFFLDNTIKIVNGSVV